MALITSHFQSFGFHKLVHGEIEEVCEAHAEINAEIQQNINTFDAGNQIFLSHAYKFCLQACCQTLILLTDLIEISYAAL